MEIGSPKLLRIPFANIFERFSLSAISATLYLTLSDSLLIYSPHNPQLNRLALERQRESQSVFKACLVPRKAGSIDRILLSVTHFETKSERLPTGLKAR